MSIAEAEGMHVVRGTGVESDSELAYGGLHQLLFPQSRCIARTPTRSVRRPTRTAGRGTSPPPPPPPTKRWPPNSKVEYLGGFWIIEAENDDVAIEWAKQASRALRSRVEVRALQEEPAA
ncbi:YciI family protein [Amycolatopsis sp. QT-25]|uniref:YciI family protein n=1 Tax=Amycolatopsis sp. QT-25 TaxID=3034022 RepID=UPI0023EB4948|nr:YciI family protein [Amycolatopsis sp. QT-25]WET80994.1 YciI family protein [Amycolatopsis sp. QT-25]